MLIENLQGWQKGRRKYETEGQIQVSIKLKKGAIKGALKDLSVINARW